jgi:hypothetical protein
LGTVADRLSLFLYVYENPLAAIGGECIRHECVAIQA